jgi:hypothetical protein
VIGVGDEYRLALLRRYCVEQGGVGGSRGPLVSGPCGQDLLVGWSTRSGAAAAGTGMHHRRREALRGDVLAWEREQGLDQPRLAGLSARRERELLDALSRTRQ